jgi:hypothetical protein
MGAAAIVAGVGIQRKKAPGREVVAEGTRQNCALFDLRNRKLFLYSENQPRDARKSEQ